VHVACLESRADIPAFAWEIEAAEREGVRIHTSLAPQRFMARHGGDGSKGIIIEFKRVASTQVDAEGRISWTLVEGPGSEYTMEADSVIIAIGQTSDPSCANGSRVMKVSRRGTFVVDPDTLATNVPRIFAAGDAVTPRGTVTQAIAMSHEAAISIHRHLQGQDLKKNRSTAKEVLKIDPRMGSPWLTRKARWGMPSLPAKDAVRTFSEADLGYSETEAIEEAKRCLNCRMCVNCIYGRNQICVETGLRLLK
jgi:NADPH-dependent glutamate synthase beta subunit-like oxidoreductase